MNYPTRESFEFPGYLEEVLRQIFTEDRCANNQLQQHEWEMRVLLKLLREELKPLHIVELGSYTGFSGALLSQVTILKTISLDITDYGTSQGAVYGHNLSFMRGNGKSVADRDVVLRRLGAAPDLVFFDDGHYYEDMQTEVNIWREVLRPRGWLVFHDINPLANLGEDGQQGVECQTTRFWQELTGNKQEIIATEEHKDFLGQVPHGGIGILRT